MLRTFIKESFEQYSRLREKKNAVWLHREHLLFPSPETPLQKKEGEYPTNS